MNQTNLDDTLDVLNDLLQTSKDGEAGFHACAEDLRDPQLKAAMLEQSRDCARPPTSWSGSSWNWVANPRTAPVSPVTCIGAGST